MLVSYFWWYNRLSVRNIVWHWTKKNSIVLIYLLVNVPIDLPWNVWKPPLISYSLRLGLFHEAKEVRAAVLRVLRYFLQEPETVDLLYSLHIDYLIVRFVTYLYLIINILKTYPIHIEYKLGRSCLCFITHSLN